MVQHKAPWAELPALLYLLPPLHSHIMEHHADLAKAWLLHKSYFKTLSVVTQSHHCCNQQLRQYAPFIILCQSYLAMIAAKKFRQASSHTDECHVFSVFRRDRCQPRIIAECLQAAQGLPWQRFRRRTKHHRPLLNRQEACNHQRLATDNDHRCFNAEWTGVQLDKAGKKRQRVE
jgi:hypothetical protein